MEVTRHTGSCLQRATSSRPTGISMHQPAATGEPPCSGSPPWSSGPSHSLHFLVSVSAFAVFWDSSMLSQYWVLRWARAHLRTYRQTTSNCSSVANTPRQQGITKNWPRVHRRLASSVASRQRGLSLPALGLFPGHLLRHTRHTFFFYGVLRPVVSAIVRHESVLDLWGVTLPAWDCWAYSPERDSVPGRTRKPVMPWRCRARRRFSVWRLVALSSATSREGSL
jgi:hypothetical protein